MNDEEILEEGLMMWKIGGWILGRIEEKIGRRM